MSMLQSVFFLLLMSFVSSKHLFLIGGALGTSGQIFTQLGLATGRQLNPNKCNQNWQTTDCPRVAVITSAAATQKDGDSAYTKDSPNDPSYYTLFKQNGFTSKHISAHIDNYKKSTDLATAEGVHNLNIIMTADIIFFNGGDQARHSRTWLADNGAPSPMFSRLLARYNSGEVVIAGTSAGTMIMSNPTYGEGISFGHLYWNAKVGLAQKSTKDGAVNGTGLADIRNGTKGLQHDDNGGKMPGFTVYSDQWLFDSHFDARGRLARLIPGLKDIKRPYGAGVDQNTAFYLYSKDGKQYGKALGQNGVWVVSNKNAKYNQTQFFQVQNIHLWYLTSGDTIDLSSFQISTSKSLITDPYNTGSINSSHVIDSYEMTKLITRLVDQTGNENVGRSKTPSGYPSNTPYFEFTFSKDKDSKGYYQNKKYTVEKILVAIKVVQSHESLEEDIVELEK